MNKIVIHHRSKHHAVNSGYGRLIDFLDAHVIYGKNNFPYRLAKWISSRSNPNAGIYDSSSVFKEVELFRYLWKFRKKNNIVHYLNAERDIRHIKFFKKIFPRTKFVATFHKPPAVLQQTITDPSQLKQLDGAICVGSNQVGFIKEWLGLEQVEYIPHGVDTDFFVPDHQKRKKNMILFVGQHLRDFDTFNQVTSLLLEEQKDLKIVVVLHRAYADKIKAHPQISIKSDVSDAELRNLYQQASLLFLPLLDSTACNSLLEAMACGLPIVTSDVGGNREYLENTNKILCEKSNIQQHFTAVIELLNKNLEPKTENNIYFRFSWKSIAEKTKEFYLIFL